MIVAKAVRMAEMMNIPVLGLVENMSYFQCPDCDKKHQLFGDSRIEEVAKQHGIEDVIAKVSRESYAELIGSMGIDMALNPIVIVTSNVLRFIQGSKRILSSQLIQGQAEIVELVADSRMKLIDIPLKNLKLPEGAIIGAIHRGLEVIIPNGETVIKRGDRVIVLCLLSELAELEKLLRTSKAGLFSRS